MNEKNHLNLIQQCLMQEKHLQVEQSLSIGLSTFSGLIQSKSKLSLLDIKLFLLNTMQENNDHEVIINLCLQMIKMVEEQIGKHES